LMRLSNRSKVIKCDRERIATEHDDDDRWWWRMEDDDRRSCVGRSQTYKYIHRDLLALKH
jgi:hypothetical protein